MKFRTEYLPLRLLVYVRDMVRTLFALALCVVASSTVAQTGVRALIQDFEIPGKKGYTAIASIGLGVDHDLTDRSSMALDWKIGTDEVASWTLLYRSAYHFADNEGPSFYMGPMLGVRSSSVPEPSVDVPLGFRFGVRGGLEGFYADLYASYITFLGSTGNASFNDERYLGPSRSALVVGLSIGVGWKRRYD